MAMSQRTLVSTSSLADASADATRPPSRGRASVSDGREGGSLESRPGALHRANMGDSHDVPRLRPGRRPPGPRCRHGLAGRLPGPARR